MSAIVKLFVKPEKKEDVKPEKSDTIQNKGEFVAAISAAIAEDLGKDISAIRITKIKKI
jgi:Na+-transporting methylmalonyl-CoA/oxaloacetate decarboxylase gamma subunit